MDTIASPARILLVDDHQLLRQSLRRVIDAEENLSVCGEAGDMESALAAVEEQPPDLAVVDVSLGTADGIDLVAQLRRVAPETKTVVLTMHEDAELLRRAFDAGAHGFLTKGDSIRSVVHAIHRVLAGNTHIGESMFESVVPLISAARRERETTPADELTEREREVLALVGQGLSTGQVAESLFISPKTVNTHRENIKKKLGLADAAALNQFAIQWQHGEA
jgi:DNA-binding NarL/FixJ family response regulator